MVRITRSSVDGPDDEVCIEMRHINVLVCVNQLVGGLRSPIGSGPSPNPHILSSSSVKVPNAGHGQATNYLNVMIKFKPMPKSDGYAIVASISDSSLCKVGCPTRERIDIESILDAAGYNLLDSLHLDTENNLGMANVSMPTSSVPECEGLYGYYLLSCLFDVKMKGLTSSDVHKSSQAKDDADHALIHKCYLQSRKASITSSSFSVHSSKIVLVSIMAIVSISSVFLFLNFGLSELISTISASTLLYFSEFQINETLLITLAFLIVILAFRDQDRRLLDGPFNEFNHISS